MENIKLNSIDKKPSGLVIVNYNDNKEATLNTKWQSQEVNFLENDVGIGGTVNVEIILKPNVRDPSKPYVNITDVDFSSSKKGTVLPPAIVSEVKVPNGPNPQRVGLFIKLAVEMEIAKPHEDMPLDQALIENVQEIHNLEKFTRNLLIQDE